MSWINAVTQVTDDISIHSYSSSTTQMADSVFEFGIEVLVRQRSYAVPAVLKFFKCFTNNMKIEWNAETNPEDMQEVLTKVLAEKYKIYIVALEFMKSHFDMHLDRVRMNTDKHPMQ